MKRHKDQKGFTLLEVMISLAIVGGLLITLIYTLTYQLGITERQFVVTNIVTFACEKMSEMRKSPENRRGRFPEPYNGWSYETKVAATPLADISQITVAVEGGKERVVLSELIQTSHSGL